MICEREHIFLGKISKRPICQICDKTEYEIELEQQLAAAKAELAAEREKREQTEAQCAAMRQILDKIYDGAKLAYSHGCSCVEISFEGLQGIGLIDIGAGTIHKRYTRYTTAETTLLTRLHRMEGALRNTSIMLEDAKYDRLQISEYIAGYIQGAKAALEEKP